MKKILGLTMALVLILALSGCDRASETIAGALRAPEATDTVGTGVPITIYSNSFNEERLTWLYQSAEFAGFNIQTVGAGGGDLAERLIEERSNPQADVVFGLNAFLWQSLISNDVITPYTPNWAGQISAGLNHPGGYYHALVIQAIMLTYDRNQIADGPTDWPDLWQDPRFHGTYRFETSLGGGTTQMVLAGILYRFRDDGRHLGISAEGWENLAAFYRYGVPNTPGVDLFEEIADSASPILMGQMFHSGVQARERNYGVNAGFPVPDVGLPFLVEGIALVNGSAQAEEAQRFIDWFGSADVQEDWQNRFDSLPANPNIHDDVSSFGEMVNGLRRQQIDWAFVADNMGDWIAYIYENLMVGR